MLKRIQRLSAAIVIAGGASMAVTQPAAARSWRSCTTCELSDAVNYANGVCGVDNNSGPPPTVYMCATEVFNCIVDDVDGMSFQFVCGESSQPCTIDFCVDEG